MTEVETGENNKEERMEERERQERMGLEVVSFSSHRPKLESSGKVEQSRQAHNTKVITNITQ